MPWEVYVDRASNQKDSGIGLVLIFPEKVIVEKSLRLSFSATNNEAEYEALLMGIAKGEFEAKDERIQGYLRQVKYLQSRFDSFDLLHISRNGNAHADSLAMLATFSAQNFPRVILVEELYKPTETRRETAQIH